MSSNSVNALPVARNSDHLNKLSRKRKIRDGDYAAESSAAKKVVGNSFSVPKFLREVFTEELGQASGGCRRHWLLVLAVHAVMLDSGFLEFDKKSKKVVRGFGFHSRGDLPSDLSLFYTPVPRGASAENVIVVLKFQPLGKFMTVYGALDNASSKRNTYSVQLNEDRLVPFLKFVWADCEVDGGLLNTSPEKEVSKFWIDVKDKLVSPLLIDSYKKSGLEYLPCFTSLPADLKLNILECLSGVDLGRVSCVSSELRNLASNDKLWKSKYVEAFGDSDGLIDGNWKSAFVHMREFVSFKPITQSCLPQPTFGWGYCYLQPPPPMPQLFNVQLPLWMQNFHNYGPWI
ncbi:hypothetical protein ACP275_02G046600 [Erythranthe tilingii]